MVKGRFTSISLHQEMQRSYLEYAMSVIVGRALPDARDGLKPVQRRILFAMHELGLTPDRPFRKCARVVGDVLGKYHPHGDQAVYDALVRLVQSFSTKYPTIQGHGNFGSVDDDPPAAMRYTETRLSPISNEALLKEIGSDTVDYTDNFDGSQKEPNVLPAQLPFLLLNGSSGIAVGMATNIPPHNLGEVVDALIALIKNRDISDLKLSTILKGPDFPTGGELLYTENLKDLYLSGRGSITIRGVVKPEEITVGKGKHKRNALIIKELPYQISKAGWIEKLADLVNNGKINGISDIRDESDREGMRIVIELRRDYNQELAISDLYKKTSLQTNFGAIFLALVDGKPVQLSLKKYLLSFLDFREKTVVKRTNYFLKIASDKLEVLKGFSIALENIKKIIDIIQASNDTNEAKYILIKEINLSTKQADAVLGMPLKKLTNLERLQLHTDIKKLIIEKDKLTNILQDRNLLFNLLTEEILELKNKYNSKRKTKVIKNINHQKEIESINKQMIDELINKKSKLIIDNKFYMYNLLGNNYKKIIEQQNKLVSNKHIHQFSCDINNNIKIFAITFNGKIIPLDWEKSLNINLKINEKMLNNNSHFDIMKFDYVDISKENYICILSEDGKFKKTLFDEEMLKSNRSFSITKLKKDIKIINSFISKQNEIMFVLTSIGRVFKFSLSNSFISAVSKQSQGINLIKLLPNEKIISACKSSDNKNIIIASKKGLFFGISSQEIYDSHNSKLGYVNERIKLKDDTFFKIFSQNQYINIETSKQRFARLNFSELDFIKSKNIYSLDFLNFNENEYINNFFSLDNLMP